MDWMSVNNMLKDDITKLSCKLMPPNYRGDIRSIRVLQDSLTRLIDILGEQSSAAQGLNRIITTADKLRTSPSHYLYLLKDPRAKGGRGDVIAFLKVGRKHLYLFDETDKVCEVEPLCVLDFFVLKERQRAGYGKILFDYMLQDQKAKPHELAIDGPSTKMCHFLMKNYGVKLQHRQNNNFAISAEFFNLVPKIISKSSRSTPVESPTVGRFAAPKPQSAIAKVIHGKSSYDAKYRGESGGQQAEASTAITPYLVQPSAPPLPELEAEMDVDLDPVPVPLPEREPVVITEIEANITKSPERPSTLSVEPVSETGEEVPAVSPAGSTMSRRDSQLTDQGYFDVKFYHNKLW